ncbi:MAG: hypothetical protein PVG14_14850 [Anaerolineales bacterium]|jgi:hypothetical protein
MNRIGFHYFPDTYHFRKSDLKTWIPELQALHATHLIILSPTDRAIPEYFISGLIESDIDPIIHFPIKPSQKPFPNDLNLLFNTYSRWGVQHICLFDRPNTRSAWTPSTWTKENLVERFLDIYLPLAESAFDAGLIPIFPPLEPGGDYWDTSFLRAALMGIKRRGYQSLLDNLILSTYTPIGNRSLNWGSGGPERWPEARPYYKPLNGEDHLGFRIYDWYEALAMAVLIEPKPIYLFGIGLGGNFQAKPGESANKTEKLLTIARLLSGEQIKGFKSVPSYVLGGTFWLLSASVDSPYVSEAWFKSNRLPKPFVSEIKEWVQTLRLDEKEANNGDHSNSHPIAHYLLLPSYDWGISDWHLEAIRPFVKRYQPTIGFSIEEAQHAVRVTVVGSTEDYPEMVLSDLRRTGSLVERIDGNGTSIATQLANR